MNENRILVEGIKLINAEVTRQEKRHNPKTHIVIILKTKQNKTKQNKTKQNKTKQNKTKQNKQTNKKQKKKKKEKKKKEKYYLDIFISFNVPK